MAKYEVTHTCGHEVTVDMIGRNREWRLERMAEYPCVSCRREERAAMNAERVLALLGSNTLPTLEAVSDKQREYAERVRDQWIAVQRIPAIGRLAVYLTTAKQWLDYDGDQRTKLIATKALEAPEGANDLARAAWAVVREWATEDRERYVGRVGALLTRAIADVTGRDSADTAAYVLCAAASSDSQGEIDELALPQAALDEIAELARSAEKRVEEIEAAKELARKKQAEREEFMKPFRAIWNERRKFSDDYWNKRRWAMVCAIPDAAYHHPDALKGYKTLSCIDETDELKAFEKVPADRRLLVAADLKLMIPFFRRPVDAKRLWNTAHPAPEAEKSE